MPALPPTDTPPPAAVSPDPAPPVEQERVAPDPAATPAPVAEPPRPAEVTSASRLKVPDSGVGTDVVDRRLVGAGDHFEEGTVVWYWTRVLGGQPGDTIRHVWIHAGRTIGVAELEVDGAYWRTQSGRQLPQGSIGDWTVEARDLEGRVLASADFTCVAAP